MTNTPSFPSMDTYLLVYGKRERAGDKKTVACNTEDVGERGRKMGVSLNVEERVFNVTIM